MAQCELILMRMKGGELIESKSSNSKRILDDLKWMYCHGSRSLSLNPVAQEEDWWW